MNTAIGSIKAKREIIWCINGWQYMSVRLRRAACSEAIYSGLYTVWQAGRLLLVQLRGFSLQRAYLRLGIAATELAQAAASWHSFLPLHVALANGFERWLHQKGGIATLPAQEKQTLMRDLRSLYEWLVSLFDNTRSTARIERRSG